MKNDPVVAMHSAEHLLNSTMVKMFGCGRSFSAHINKKKSKCDYRFERELTREEIAEIEERVNRVIKEDLPVSEFFLEREEASGLFDLERLPESVGEQVRIIRMGEVDAVPCIGDHVAKTSQIKGFKITTTSFENGLLRIRFKLNG